MVGTEVEEVWSVNSRPLSTKGGRRSFIELSDEEPQDIGRFIETKRIGLRGNTVSDSFYIKIYIYI